MTLKLSQFTGRIPIEPYPVDKLDIPDLPPYEPYRYYTICMAVRDLYIQLSDPEQRLKLRYIATIAKAITDRIQALDPEFFHKFYPRVGEFDSLMRNKEAQNGRD